MTAKMTANVSSQIVYVTSYWRYTETVDVRKPQRWDYHGVKNCDIYPFYALHSARLWLWQTAGRVSDGL